MKTYVRLYIFLSQIVDFENAYLERLYIFLNHLQNKLVTESEPDFSQGVLDTIDMDSYRLQLEATTNIAMEQGDDLQPIPTEMRGGVKDPEIDQLSNILKTNAFRMALPDEPKLNVDKLIEYHLSNGGITRQKKFEYYYSKIKNKCDPQKVLEASNRFAAICEKELLEVDLVPGIENFLMKHNIPAYVVTGGNELEVNNVLIHKGLSHYFKIILGNPKSKDVNMSLLKDRGFFVGKGLYFGDSKLDYELAIKYGLDFIFISGHSDWISGRAFCEDLDLKIFNNFEEIIRLDDLK